MKTKILIVDDRVENIKALSLVIEDEDIEILSSQTAEGALDLLVNHDFALAILDVQMPVMSGFELARLIRGVKRFRHLPVMFVTAHLKDQSFIFEGYETGAVDLLFKPLDPHVVRSKVRTFVKIDQQNQVLKAQLEEMKRLRIEAEAANVAKSRFLANMSHEIRTPLGAVMGFADVISQTAVSDEEREQYAAAIRRNGELLTRVIDDILDFSKIEAHKMDFEKVPFRFDEVLRDTTSMLQAKAQDKGILFEVKSNVPASAQYICDPVRLKQVFLNVIGNAIKFTSQGEVKVSVESNPANPSENGIEQDSLSIQVSDTGIGMTEEQVKHLFQPFSQADASTQRQFGGTGLGLVIAKELARALGGDLQLLQSQEGRGTTFFIGFLLEKAGNGEQLKSAQGKKRILIVDDMQDNQLLMRKFLESTQFEIVLASHGEEAIEKVESSPPDLILMDIQMPGMDGREATRKIRDRGFSMPIVALTGHSSKEELDLCRKAGCDDVLTKPVSKQRLLSLVRNFLEAPGKELSGTEVANLSKKEVFYERSL